MLQNSSAAVCSYPSVVLVIIKYESTQMLQETKAKRHKIAEARQQRLEREHKQRNQVKVLRHNRGLTYNTKKDISSRLRDTTKVRLVE